MVVMTVAAEQHSVRIVGYMPVASYLSPFDDRMLFALCHEEGRKWLASKSGGR